MLDAGFCRWQGSRVEGRGASPIRLKLGEVFGNEKPEFKGAIDGTVGQADAGDSALDCGLQTVPIVGSDGGFEGEKSGAQMVGHAAEPRMGASESK